MTLPLLIFLCTSVFQESCICIHIILNEMLQLKKKTAPFLASITQKMYAPSQSSASWHHWDLKRQIRHTFLAACCNRDTIHNKMGRWQLGCILQSKSTRARQLEPESPVLRMLRFLFVKWMQPIPLNKFSENVSPLLTKM